RVSNVRHDVDPVDGVTADLGFGGGCIGFLAAVRQPVYRRRFRHVVAHRRLVINHRDGAAGAGTERVLLGRVGKAARARNGDVVRGHVRGAPDLIELAVVGAVEGTSGAVRRNAWRVGGGIDVTWSKEGTCAAGSAR